MAPSASNRQPWRFAVVTSAELRRTIIAAVRERSEVLREAISHSPHASDLDGYFGFFFGPLETAPAIVVPQYRPAPDLLRQLLESSGADVDPFPRAEDLQVEMCATSAALMAMLLQAHVEGLGACWMTIPLLAYDEISAALGIRPPWRVLALVPVGYPVGSPQRPPRRSVEQVTRWLSNGSSEEHCRETDND